MNRELVNREQRLRYKARKKGLYIKKGKWYQYYDTYRYESHTGYGVGRLDLGLLIAGYDEYNNNLMTIEEVEEFVEDYQEVAYG